MAKKNLDTSFIELYKAICNQAAPGIGHLLVNLSILPIYLTATGRMISEKPVRTVKLYIKSTWECFQALAILAKVCFRSVFYKKHSCAILVSDPTHMNQVQGMKKYLADYNPLFITDKKSYINIIRSECATKSVVYIPPVFINWPVISKKWFSDLLGKHDIEVEEQTFNNLRRTLNESYARTLIIKFIIRILAWLNPLKFMMVFNDLTFTGRTFARFINKTSCKSIYVMHGLLSDELIGSLHISEYYFIFGEYTRPVLTEHGIKDEQIFTIGTPYLEYYRKTQKTFPLKDHINRSAELEKKNTILILLSGFGHTTSKKHHEIILKSLATLIGLYKDRFHFIFKLHRKDHTDNYQVITSDPALKNAFDIFSFDHFNEQETIFDWINICDAIITGASTTAIEAMYLNKPVITIDLMKEYEYETLHIRNGATYHARTLEELLSLFHVVVAGFSVKQESMNTAQEFFSSPQLFEDFFSTSIKKLFPL